MENMRDALQKDKKLFFLFKAAIQDERRAQETYKTALEYTDNPALNEVLKRLHQDEVRHEEDLRAYYSELRRKLTADGTPIDTEGRHVDNR